MEYHYFWIEVFLFVLSFQRANYKLVFRRREYCKTPGKSVLIEINILPHAEFCNPKPFPSPLPSLENRQTVALFYNKSKLYSYRYLK